MRIPHVLGSLAVIASVAIGCSKKGEETDFTLVEKHFPIIRDSIFFSPYGGYGYDVIVNGEVKIHQPGVPGTRGNIGFSSASDARRTAGEVIDKMKISLFPQAVTMQELKELIVTAQQ